MVVWEIMGWAVERVLQVSGWVDGFGGLALACLAFALLLVTLLASPLRWMAVVPAAAGVGLAANPPRNDLYFDRGGAGAAVRGADQRLTILGRPSSFTVEQW